GLDVGLHFSLATDHDVGLALDLALELAVDTDAARGLEHALEVGAGVQIAGDLTGLHGRRGWSRAGGWRAEAVAHVGNERLLLGLFLGGRWFTKTTDHLSLSYNTDRPAGFRRIIRSAGDGG